MPARTVLSRAPYGRNRTAYVMYTYTHIYIYIYTYIHTHMYIYIYIYISSERRAILRAIHYGDQACLLRDACETARAVVYRAEHKYIAVAVRSPTIESYYGYTLVLRDGNTRFSIRCEFDATRVYAK